MSLVLYLRLFWTEFYFGWNSEEWFSYLVASIVLAFIALLAVRFTRRKVPQIEEYVSTWSIPTIWVPLCIILYFAAGRVTVQPMSKGLIEMNNFGCCSQGLLFPRTKAETLLQWYEEHDAGLIDMLTEEYADRHGETRYAMNPPVMQHVGMQSSKPGRESQMDIVPENWVTPSHKLWNFVFELQDPVELRVDHLMASSEEKDSTT
jgi:hypothetical protein